MFYTGKHFLCSEKERLKNRKEADYLTSSCHVREKLLVGYKTGGNLKYLREQFFPTYHCDMFELIREIISEVKVNTLFFSSSECFKVPFPYSNFDDAILMKVSIVKGGGSTRAMLNLVNVKKHKVSLI